MKVTLYEHTPDAEYVVGYHAAECYDSDTDREKCIKRAKHCRDSGHLATLRFAYATFGIEGISRVCSHQLVRVAHAGILQRSQRYIKETSVSYIDPPSLIGMPGDLQNDWADIQDRAESLYLRMVDYGMKKEDARYILPQGCQTSMRLCLNFQGWKDILNNRTSKHAQWEIRDVANEIKRQLGQMSPNLFGE